MKRKPYPSDLSDGEWKLIEVIKRNKKEFEFLPRRWVVERTFAWLVKNRRLVEDL